jgi:hypothetical protein
MIHFVLTMAGFFCADWPVGCNLQALGIAVMACLWERDTELGVYGNARLNFVFMGTRD